MHKIIIDIDHSSKGSKFALVIIKFKNNEQNSSVNYDAL